MPTNILMPALSPTMTEGTLARWLKKEGEAIRAGDVVAEIETDKATMEVEAVDDGVLGRILVADGTQGVKVNAPIAVLVGEGEDADVAKDGGAPPPAAPADAPAPSAGGGAPQESGPAPSAPAAVPGSPPPPAEGTSSRAPQPNGHAEPAASGGRIFASPLARRMAKQAGIELSGIRGSGPNGRIVRADVEAARGVAPTQGSMEAQAGAREAGPSPTTASAAPAPAATPAAPAPGAPPAPAKAAPITAPHTLVPHSGMRRTIARRLAESKQTVPHFYLSCDVELDALLKLRADLNARSPEDGTGAYKLSVNDLVIKAAAVALRRVPKVNASWTEEGTAEYRDVDISVAVAIPDGLITPIIRQADQKGLAAISREMKDLAARAKAGKLKPEEFQGGGFSISNLGMFGIREFSAIINPPQSAILAVGAGEQRPVVKGGTLAVATVMTCTLSVDHRVVDGALGAEWLQAFRSLIEDPLGIML